MAGTHADRLEFGVLAQPCSHAHADGILNVKGCDGGDDGQKAVDQDGESRSEVALLLHAQGLILKDAAGGKEGFDGVHFFLGYAAPEGDIEDGVAIFARKLPEGLLRAEDGQRILLPGKGVIRQDAGYGDGMCFFSDCKADILQEPDGKGRLRHDQNLAGLPRSGANRTFCQRGFGQGELIGIKGNQVGMPLHPLRGKRQIIGEHAAIGALYPAVQL